MQCVPEALLECCVLHTYSSAHHAQVHPTYQEVPHSGPADAVTRQRGAAPGHTQARYPSAGAQAEARSDERAAAAPRTLVSAVLAAWPADQPYPLATVRTSLGQAGCIEVETRAMLEMEGVADVPFGPEVLACLPPVPWTISAAELAGRRDFRSARCARARAALRLRCRAGWHGCGFMGLRGGPASIPGARCGPRACARQLPGHLK